ncbi:heme biosynthesis protein [Beggiatoa sp. PS]|nr:heme biosynthesis protein [Beggiatoa sp. PS]
MKYIALCKDAFYRNFEEIGYLYNQNTKNEIVLDLIGSIFVSKIQREPVLIRDITQQLCAIFPNVTKDILKSDFINFALPLENSGFVIFGDSIEEVLQKICLQSNAQNLENNTDTTVDPQVLLRKHFIKHSKPFYVHIELTSACNLNCVHCYWPNHFTRHIPKDKLFNILDQLSDMGSLHLSFSGGESLLHPNFIEIVRYARKLDFSVTIMTNGTLLSKKLIYELRQLAVAEIQVSLYSMDASVHDAITKRVGSFEKTKKNIKTLLDSGCHVKIACPVTKINASTFSSVAEYYSPQGVSVGNDLYIVAKTDFSKDNLKHRLDICEIDQVVSILVKQNATSKVIHKDNGADNKLSDEPICGAAVELLCLSANGNLSPCPSFEYIFGNAFTQSVSDIWNNSQKAIKIRNLTRSKYTKCVNCDAVDYCSICPARFFNESGGDYLTPCDYFCEISKRLKYASEMANVNHPSETQIKVRRDSFQIDTY